MNPKGWYLPRRIFDSPCGSHSKQTWSPYHRTVTIVHLSAAPNPWVTPSNSCSERLNSIRSFVRGTGKGGPKILKSYFRCSATDGAFLEGTLVVMLLIFFNNAVCIVRAVYDVFCFYPQKHGKARFNIYHAQYHFLFIL